MRVVCVDFGSTFTKLLVVDTETGSVIASSSAPTTIDSDVIDGFDNAKLLVRQVVPEVDDLPVHACSSAGGGLRLAVVGYERAITAEAGYRVGLSAGAKVVHVSSGTLTADSVGDLVTEAPDVVLLVGGTDGGNSEVLLANARTLASAGLQVPVVVAGNTDVRDRVVGILRRRRVVTYSCTNVLPRIGVLDPIAARTTIREVFIDHVIGGKHLSSRTDLRTFVEAATPDAVLTGVELLADGSDDMRGVGDVVVVDVGGATTDVYSVVTPDAEQEHLEQDAVGALWRSRTVEGDLGVRWNAVGIVAAALQERLIDSEAADALMPAASQRVSDPSYLPTEEQDAAVDRSLAGLAATVALRRHARPHESGSVRYSGKDLRNVSLVVGSGGVLRHAPAASSAEVVAAAVADPSGGWRHPDHAQVVVDSTYVLAAAGLLANEHRAAAFRLVQRYLRADAAS